MKRYAVHVKNCSNHCLSPSFPSLRPVLPLLIVKLEVKDINHALDISILIAECNLSPLQKHVRRIAGHSNTELAAAGIFLKVCHSTARKEDGSSAGVTVAVADMSYP